MTVAAELDLRRNRLKGGAGLPLTVHTEAQHNVSGGDLVQVELFNNELAYNPLNPHGGDERYIEYQVEEAGFYIAESLRGEGLPQKVLFRADSTGGIHFYQNQTEMLAALQDEVNGKHATDDGFVPLIGDERYCREAASIRRGIYGELAKADDDAPQNTALRNILCLPIDASWWLERKGTPARDLLLEIAMESEEAYALLMDMADPSQ